MFVKWVNGGFFTAILRILPLRDLQKKAIFGKKFSYNLAALEFFFKTLHIGKSFCLQNHKLVRSLLFPQFINLVGV